jgi:hypothetical protein
MNERIRELVRESGLDDADFPIEDWDNVPLEKFAELIVAECLDVIALRLYLGPVELCRQECKAVAVEIKQHFGLDDWLKDFRAKPK